MEKEPQGPTLPAVAWGARPLPTWHLRCLLPAPGTLCDAGLEVPLSEVLEWDGSCSDTRTLSRSRGGHHPFSKYPLKTPGMKTRCNSLGRLSNSPPNTKFLVMLHRTLTQ